MIMNFNYTKEFKKLPDRLIKKKISELLGGKVSDDLLKFLYLNKGGIVRNTNFIFEGRKYYVSCIPGFGSKKLLENIVFNYEGVTKTNNPGMLEIIQLLDEEGIFYSINQEKYIFIEDGRKIEIASTYSELMNYFEEEK